EPNYDDRLATTFSDCMTEWIKATNAKIDFVFTNDPKKADITCRWSDPHNPYTNLHRTTKVPTINPTMEKAGETKITILTQSGKELRITKVTIDILAQKASSRIIDDDTLRAVCLHEIGHALGIRKHFKPS